MAASRLTLNVDLLGIQVISNANTEEGLIFDVFYNVSSFSVKRAKNIYVRNCCCSSIFKILSEINSICILINVAILFFNFAEHVIPANAVDRRRCSWSEQRQFRSYGCSLNCRRFPFAFPLAQETSSSPQKQKRAPSTGETAQKASPKSRTESRLYSQSDQVVYAEQWPHLLRWDDSIPFTLMNYFSLTASRTQINPR